MARCWRSSSGRPLGTDDAGHPPGRFAGSFEGLSTFAAGVRTKLPFRVFTGDQVRRVVVDIAH
ncbi:hypothetical protein ABJI51_02905 [Amycolatopsis sp. NEAU-NG30]|uniref:AMIN-like domain-containing protein n=1 Tax=Amycolatopsis melonis TaxID=3156488 RepID=A0ABV0L9I9_9PSEU